MKIAIVGTGYVGLVSGACFAEMGSDVTCVDIDRAKIEGLKQGIIPIYEPGLDELVRRNVRDGRLHFTTSLEEVINDVEAVFSAVGTPPDDDGSADLTAVKAVARTFGRHITRPAILVTKSTAIVHRSSCSHSSRLNTDSVPLCAAVCSGDSRCGSAAPTWSSNWPQILNFSRRARR